MLKKGGKFFIFKIFCPSLLLWIIGIFLFPHATFAANNITTERLIELTNQERGRFGLNELVINKKLTDAALNKANDLIQANAFSHSLGDKTFSQWIKDVNYQYSVVGENLAINFSDSDSLFNAWLASPEHKKNILHPNYQEIGVAVVDAPTANNDFVLVVEIFGTPALTAEPIVPSYPTLSTNSFFNSPLVLSGVAHNYSLLNTNSSDLFYTQPQPSEIFLNTPKNKNTVFLNYFWQTVRWMSIYMTGTLFLVLVYFYINDLTWLNQKIISLRH